MKYIIYIVLFISGIAFAQGGNVVRIAPDTVSNSPVITTTQKLQGSMPNAAIIRSQSYPELPKTIKGQLISFAPVGADTFFNTYTLTQADKDSLYAAAFNGQIVQQAIKAKFNGKSKLFERGYEMELLSLLKSDSISNDSKKQLLTRRLLADAEYDKANNIQADRRKWCPQNGLDKNAAIDFYRCLTISDFTACLYVIDGLLYTPASANGVQSLLHVLRKTQIATLQVLRGDEAATVLYCQTPPDVIIITTAKH